MGIHRGRGTQRWEEKEVLAGVGEVIFAPDHMGDAHGNVIHHIHQVENWLTVRSDQGKVTLFRALHPSPHRVGEGDRCRPHLLDFGLQVLVPFGVAFPIEAKENCPVLPVGVAGIEQLVHSLVVKCRPLALKIGTCGPLNARAFIPPQPEPAHPFEQDFQGFLSVALLVGVFDAEDKIPSCVAGVEPVEKRRPCAADVEKAGWAGGESDSDLLHKLNLSAAQ